MAQDRKRWLRRYLSQGKPAIGLCLGGQLIANALGAAVSRNQEQELGWTTVRKVAHVPEDCFVLPEQFEIMQWHSETFELPKGRFIWQKMKPAVIRCINSARMFWVSSFIRNYWKL